MAPGKRAHREGSAKRYAGQSCQSRRGEADGKREGDDLPEPLRIEDRPEIRSGHRLPKSCAIADGSIETVQCGRRCPAPAAARHRIDCAIAPIRISGWPRPRASVHFRAFVGHRSPSADCGLSKRSARDRGARRGRPAHARGAVLPYGRGSSQSRRQHGIESRLLLLLIGQLIWPEFVAGARTTDAGAPAGVGASVNQAGKPRSFGPEVRLQRRFGPDSFLQNGT